MREEYAHYFKELDKTTKEYNSLLKKGIEYAPQQIKCLTYGFDTIQRCQLLNTNYFITYEEGKNTVDLEGISILERINYDYKTSEYAEKFYSVACNFRDNFDKLFFKNGCYVIPAYKKMMDSFKINMKIPEYIAARWHTRRFMEVFDENYDPNKPTRFPNPKKLKVAKRIPLLQEACFFVDRMIATKLGGEFKDGIMPRKVIFSVQPNSGKTFLSNAFCDIGLILHKIYYKSSGIIRINNTAGNAIGCSTLCKNMLSDIKITYIYPELTKYFGEQRGKYKCTIFKKEASDEWLLQDLDNSIRASMFAVGRETAINGLRNDVALVIDDISDGFDQMNNDQAHIDMVNKYDVDMDSRKEDESVPELIIGTMFNENGLQNTLIKRAEAKYGKLVPVKKKGFSNSLLTPDKSMAVILVDCFNSKMESIAPDLISTEKLIDKMNTMVGYQFDLVYRQKNGSRDPKTFEYDTLFQYKPDDKADLEETSVCAIDPTRMKSSDYFVAMFFRKNKQNGKYRFVDVICEQESLGKVNDPKNKFAQKLIKAFIDNKCTKVLIENNTSNLIATYLDDLLQKQGYNFCKFREIYNTGKKLTRILDMEMTIKNNIEFPTKNSFPLKHRMTTAMMLLTKWDNINYGKKGNYDDVPDCTAMFANEFIYKESYKAKLIAGDLPYGL